MKGNNTVRNSNGSNINYEEVVQLDEEEEQSVSEDEFNSMNDLIEIIKNNPNGYISETELEWNLRELLPDDNDTSEILSKLPFEKAIQVRILLNGFIEQLKEMNLPPPSLNHTPNNNHQLPQLQIENIQPTLTTLSTIFKKQTIIKNNKLNSIISNRNEINNLSALNNQLNLEITKEKSQYTEIKLKYDKLLNDCINDQKLISFINQQFKDFKLNVNSILIEKNDELLKLKNQLHSIKNENHKLKSTISKNDQHSQLLQVNEINNELLQLQFQIQLKDKKIKQLKQQLHAVAKQQKEKQQLYTPVKYEVLICLIFIFLFYFTLINYLISV